jgi:ubiquinone/menaquinone biosynthesis C-methylase UbiE
MESNRMNGRHQQFLRLLDGNTNASLIDLGCGFGGFLRFLCTEGRQGRFIGYDIAPTMIEKARELHGEAPDHEWRIGANPATSASKSSSSS